MLASYDRIRSIFLEAVRNVPRDRWNAFLGEACLGEYEMHQQVQRLLDAHVAEGTFPFGHHQIATETSAADVRESVGALIGPYKLLEQIGEGGMGLVYMAEQQQPVRRLVALKLVKPGMDTKQVLARFEAERQAVAMMDHPHIAKVHDAGTTKSGLPYFVMELVRGIPINEFCDQQRFTIRHRLELFIQVCQAVEHAHRDHSLR